MIQLQNNLSIIDTIAVIRGKAQKPFLIYMALCFTYFIGCC